MTSGPSLPEDGGEGTKPNTMSESHILNDADFGIDFDAPPGYRSANDKSQFQLWFAVMVGAV